MRAIFVFCALLLFGLAFSADAMVRIINRVQLVEIRKQMLTAVVIDSRSNKDFDNITIPGAKRLPVDRMTEEALAAMVPSKSNPVIFYCHSITTNASGEAASKASSWGYTNIFRYTGGISDWVVDK